jgi:hypothetical protein
MNYFVIEGYKDAAETFSQECGLTPSIDVDSIQDRMNIRNAIQNGNVEEAIERVNDLNPEVMYIFFFLFHSFKTMIRKCSCTTLRLLFESMMIPIHQFSLQYEFFKKYKIENI